MLENKPQIPPNYESPAQKVKQKWEGFERNEIKKTSEAQLKIGFLFVIFFIPFIWTIFIFDNHRGLGSKLNAWNYKLPEYNELSTLKGKGQILGNGKGSHLTVNNQSLSFYCMNIGEYWHVHKPVEIKIDKHNNALEIKLDNQIIYSYEYCSQKLLTNNIQHRKQLFFYLVICMPYIILLIIIITTKFFLRRR